ncbi:dynein assembly factor 3, axonemal homolog [Agrilus planipennis]|uniref:Dynein assembly factor 3, axonemal homolog n=1 Tax=Agrilus planipennis TaxID=224129 RepID=A0A1W4WL36_AGRPL|nr:dynein assembly factor 3, axonemal homolog [Agrilus planipennis]
MTSRYDTKIGAFDWDLNMQLHHRGGRQLCSQEYRHWRTTGVAFTWMECDFSKPNRSFVTGVFPNGKSYLHYGYLGDILTGPFAAYGLECEDKEFLKSSNGQNVHRATDVTERNLMQIFHELETQDKYSHHKVNDYILGPAGFQLPQERVVDSYGGGFEKCVGKCFAPDDVTITFVSLSKMALMKNKDQLKNRFSIIYFASEYIKHFDVDLVRHLASTGCLLFIENKLFNPSVRNEELQKFSEEILNVAEPISSLTAPFDCTKDFYAKFLIKSNS